MSVAFDGRVPGTLVPLFGGSGQVTFVLNNVQVTAPDDGFGAVELGEIRGECGVPGLLSYHGLETFACIDGICSDKKAIFKLERDNATFGILILETGQAIYSLDRLNLGEDSKASVALLLADAPILMLVDFCETRVHGHIVDLGF